MFSMTNDIKEIKRERMKQITNFTDNLLSYVTSSNIIKGNIIIFFHYAMILVYLSLMIFLPINRLNIIILFCIILIHNTVNIYYAKWDTCVLVKFERLFFNDYSWYGPNTRLFKLFNMNKPEYHKYMQIFNLSGWILLYLFYFYRLYNHIFNKNRKDKRDNKREKQ